MHKPHTPDNVPSDPRSAGELATDWVDFELLDFYREIGILDLPESTVYSIATTRAFIRAAFAQGVWKGFESPEEYRQWMDKYSDAKEELLPPEDLE